MNKRKISLKETGEKDFFKNVNLICGKEIIVYVRRKENETVFLFDDRKKDKEHRPLKYSLLKKDKIWTYRGNEFKSREEGEEFALLKIYDGVSEIMPQALLMIEKSKKWRVYLGGKEKSIKEGEVLYSVRIEAEKGQEDKGDYYLYLGKEKIEKIEYKNEKRALRLFLYDYVFKNVEKERKRKV